ncbi:MAG: ABC transporter ATP-binding protein [Cyclobacteriaceae bacterium]
MKPDQPLLKIQNLNLQYETDKGVFTALKGINLEIKKGEILAIVGETGSGKTSLGRALLNINPENATTRFEQVEFGQNSSIADPSDLNALRGREIAMLFQEPTLYLNPSMSCGKQILETALLDEGIGKKEAKNKILEELLSLGFSDPDKTYKSFPNQLSGGECQRVMLVMATIRNPGLLIADEPTSSVDIETKEKIFEYFKRLVDDHQMSIILITHDLSLALNHSDRIVVMNEGTIVDNFDSEDRNLEEKSAYAQKLFSIREKERMEEESDDISYESEEFLSVQNLNIYHASSGGRSLFFNEKKHAVKDATFTINKGETLGILGESGSGKTSLVWCLSGLIAHQSGTVHFPKNLQKGDIQMVFQNPGLALSPKQKVGKAVCEVATANSHKYNGNFDNTVAAEYFEMVGLSADLLTRLPQELSGGEKQRVCIAKALAAKPKMIIFDEAVSSLDAAVKMDILELLIDLRDRLNLTYIFISHDESVIKFVADRIMTMADGVLSEAILGTSSH